MSNSTPTAPARRHGLRIGRIFGINFYLDYSWFIIAAIVVYDLTERLFPGQLAGREHPVYLAMGVAAAALFFLSILLHEIGHALVSQRCGIPVPRITLLFIGGIAEISREPDDPKSEFKIAIGGPAVTVVLIVLFASGWFLFDLGNIAAASLICQWLAVVNLGLLIFNAIPGYPLDGGRVLRSIIWQKTGNLRRATHITSRIAIGFSYLLIALGIWLFIHSQWNAFGFFLIGIFLKNAAEAGYQQAIYREVLSGVRVRDLMNKTPISIPTNTPVNIAVDDYFLAHHHAAFPVCDEDHEFCGLVRLEYLKELPREKWPYLSVGDLAASNESLKLSVAADESARKTMQRLLVPGSGRLAVLSGNQVVGIITRHDILQFIKVHTELDA